MYSSFPYENCSRVLVNHQRACSNKFQLQIVRSQATLLLQVDATNQRAVFVTIYTKPDEEPHRNPTLIFSKQ